MKKLLGLALWLLAFLIPFRYAILDTTDLLQPDGSVDNIKGLIGFVATIALLFTGYFLIDSSRPEGEAEEAHGH